MFSAKKRWECANTVKVVEWKATQVTGKEGKLLNIEAKKKNKDERKRYVKAIEAKVSCYNNHHCLLPLQEYMPWEWFRMVEEKNEEEEVIYTCKMIIVDIDFQECIVEIMQDLHPD